MSLSQGSSYSLLQAWPGGTSWLSQAQCRLTDDADVFFGRDRDKAQVALRLCRRSLYGNRPERDQLSEGES